MTIEGLLGEKRPSEEESEAREEAIDRLLVTEDIKRCIEMLTREPGYQLAWPPCPSRLEQESAWWEGAQRDETPWIERRFACW